MQKKIKVGVVYGGSSTEREVSLVTGEAVIKNLDRKKYVVTPIEMTRDNHFVVKGRTKLDFLGKDNKRFDVIFLALHGSPGEDGTVQGLLDVARLPYTGSKALASALSMDKARTAAMYYAAGLPTPPFVYLDKTIWKNNQASFLKTIKKEISYPAVLKPTDQGSTVGVTIVKNEKELTMAIVKTLKKFPHLLVQKFIKGKEATCGVLDVNGEVRALPPTHIKPNFDEFYDFGSKYKPGGSTHVCPADFPAEVNKKMQEYAVQAHRALGCSGMSRTDIFYADDGKLWVIETNTIPGMTPTSLLPEAAAAEGITFPRMLDYIIAAALKKN